VEKDEALTLTAETREAVAAVKFIAAHLKQEDDFAEVDFARFLSCATIDIALSVRSSVCHAAVLYRNGWRGG